MADARRRVVRRGCRVRARGGGGVEYNLCTGKRRISGARRTEYIVVPVNVLKFRTRIDVRQVVNKLGVIKSSLHKVLPGPGN